MSKKDSTKSVPLHPIKEQPRKSGRFDSKYQDNYPDMLIEHMANGFSFRSFGGVVRACAKTLFNWADEHEDFRAAKAMGRELSLYEWEKIGKDGLYEIVQKDDDGNINRLKMNSAVYLANMRNRFDWDRPDKATIEGDIKIDIDKDDAEL